MSGYRLSAEAAHRAGVTTAKVSSNVTIAAHYPPVDDPSHLTCGDCIDRLIEAERNEQLRYKAMQSRQRG